MSDNNLYRKNPVDCLVIQIPVSLHSFRPFPNLKQPSKMSYLSTYGVFEK